MPGYFETRLAHNAHRTAVWQHICALSRALDPGLAVRARARRRLVRLLQQRAARRVVAMDLDAMVERAAAAARRPRFGDCTDLGRFADGSFDVVFASNLLEHLDRPAAARLLAEARGCCARAAG